MAEAQQKLARLAGVGTVPVDQLKTGLSLDIIRCIRNAGVEFIDENGGAGVRLRKRQSKKVGAGNSD